MLSPRTPKCKNASKRDDFDYMIHKPWFPTFTTLAIRELRSLWTTDRDSISRNHPKSRTTPLEWPNDHERVHYFPFATYLNDAKKARCTAMDSLRSQGYEDIPSSTARYLQNLKSTVYDRATIDKTEGLAGSVKPDIVGSMALNVDIVSSKASGRDLWEQHTSLGHFKHRIDILHRSNAGVIGKNPNLSQAAFSPGALPSSASRPLDPIQQVFCHIPLGLIWRWVKPVVRIQHHYRMVCL